MKRVAPVCIVLLSVLLFALCQPAVDPDRFSGYWYSSEDQTLYQFQNGLIFCEKHAISSSDPEFLSGAYSYSNRSLYLFVKGIDGLEKETQIYLIQGKEGNFLCENRDGTGKIYFIQSQK